MNRKLTIAVVAGIRSQYMKLCAFQRMFDYMESDIKEKFDFIYIDAGQHYGHDLAQGYIGSLKIKFDYELKHKSKEPIEILGSMITQLYYLFRRIRENKGLDYVIVFGDANTTLAGAIATSKARVKLIHIESGLRIGDKTSPEEGNRIVADHLATLHFVSNRSDFNNIIKEGLSETTYFSGDIIYDLVLDIARQGFSDIYIEENERVHLYDNVDFVLASMHREENLREGILPRLFEVLNTINHDVLFVAHPREMDEINNLTYDKSKITISNHVNYTDMLAAIDKCKYIITDSGAVQREAYYLQKRCLIRQDRAFWQSLVDLGIHRLIGKTVDKMQEGVEWIENITNSTANYPSTMDLGDGHAVEFIIRKIFEIGVHRNANLNCEVINQCLS